MPEVEMSPVRTGWDRSMKRGALSATPVRPATGLAVLLLILAGLTPLQAAPAAVSEQVSPAPSPRFQTDLLPILRTHCLRCHNSEARLAGLDLSTEAALFQGSASGSVLAPGRPQESPLYRMVHKGLMPPDKQTAPSPSELATLQAWIASLAVPGSPEHSHASRAGVPTVTQQEIIPLMLLHCTACHGQRIQEAGLDLRSKASMLKGGNSGPAIVPGKPEESLIVQRIRAREMPPSEREVEASLRPMSDRGLEQLVRWISLGAPEASGEDRDEENGSDPLVSKEDRRFWSFQPPKATVPPLPGSAGPSRLRNPVDAFIAARLREKGLPPLARGRPPDADPARQLRPDRAAAGTRGGPALPGRPRPRRLRGPHRAAAGLTPLRRALGPALAGPGGLFRPPPRLALPGLRHSLAQRRQALRPLPAGATGRRRAGGPVRPGPSSLGKPWTT